MSRLQFLIAAFLLCFGLGSLNAQQTSTTYIGTIVSPAAEQITFKVNESGEVITAAITPETRVFRGRTQVNPTTLKAGETTVVVTVQEEGAHRALSVEVRSGN